MSLKAMKQALDLLETSWGNGHEDTLKHWNETAQVLRQAIAEAEKQEPADLARVGEVGVWGNKHEWVGLTEDEVMNIWYQNGFECMIYAKAIEAKLKEKNT